MSSDVQLPDAPPTADGSHASEKKLEAGLASVRPNLPPPPDGGLQAWLVAIGAMASNCSTFGYIQSFGIYQSYYSTHQLSDQNSSDISWIGSLQICLLFLGGIASGPLFDRYGSRAVLIPASITLVFAVMMTSLCTEFWQFILAQGILGGLASGMIFTPAVSTVGQYFSKRRALAMGVTVSGASIGGVIFPIALNRMLFKDAVGFGWSVRTIGFIMVPLLTFTCTFVVERAPHRKGNMFLPAAFKSVPFIFTNAGFFFSLLGLYTPIFYIVKYSEIHGVSTNMSFYEVAILNAASFFGRTLPNYLADKVGRFNLNFVVTTAAAILIFCWTKTETNAGITVFTVFYGLASGAVVSLFSPCIAEVVTNPSEIGTYLGMSMAIASLAGLTGTPISGAIIDNNGGSYTQAAIWSGVITMVGAACTLVARLAHNRKLFAIA